MNQKIAAPSFDAILVPTGQEYRAVCRGLQRLKGKKPQVIAIPLGMKAVAEFWKMRSIADICQKQQPNLLLMGLAGGLSPQHRVGDIVIYRDCLHAIDAREYQSQECDRDLTALLQENLGSKVRLVRGLTSKDLIYSAEEKQRLARLYPASVVDMEGFSLLSAVGLNRASIAIVRVVSDDFSQNIPNLTMSFRENGSINSLLLAIALIKEPFAARRLIRNSLRSLSILERVTAEICSNS